MCESCDALRQEIAEFRSQLERLTVHAFLAASATGTLEADLVDAAGRLIVRDWSGEPLSAPVEVLETISHPDFFSQDEESQLLLVQEAQDGYVFDASPAKDAPESEWAAYEAWRKRNRLRRQRNKRLLEARAAKNRTRKGSNDG